MQFSSFRDRKYCLHASYAGTGQPANNVAPGQPCYRERVSFGKVIGNYVGPAIGEKMPTTNDISHYSKDGGSYCFWVGAEARAKAINDVKSRIGKW
ncbi:polymorphic toxin type 50 domain-containing protein [Burkholderia multivorans]|uniref:polymorphic toxin type 50 domain-containing protein n=1 Tax=Burkholderia multivorans TaxID=87883 RepID=UPI0009BE223F